MCLGIAYKYQGQDHRVYFLDPKARLPVKKKSGKEVLVSWGRRKSERINFPLGAPNGKLILSLFLRPQDTKTSFPDFFLTGNRAFGSKK